MDKINESRIAYLYESIRCGTMRAAADKLDVAPSAVSRQIALLEEELGVSLIERHKRGVTLTEGGRILIEYYREQRAYQDDVLSKLQDLRGLRTGHVSVVLGEGFIWDLMSGPLTHFCAEYPGISLSLDVAAGNEVIRRVAEDEAEIGLVFSPPQDPKIVSRASSKQPVFAVVAPGFPLLKKRKPVAFADLAAYPHALLDASFGFRQLLNMVEHTEKVRLAPAMTTNSFVILKQFVKLGLGFTFFTRLVVASEVAAGEMCLIPVAQPLLENAEVHLITRTGRHLSVAANRMMQHMIRKMYTFNKNL